MKTVIDYSLLLLCYTFSCLSPHLPIVDLPRVLVGRPVSTWWLLNVTHAGKKKQMRTIVCYLGEPAC